MRIVMKGAGGIITQQDNKDIKKKNFDDLFKD